MMFESREGAIVFPSPGLSLSSFWGVMFWLVFFFVAWSFFFF
jgi:hypothetical protein